MDKQYEPNWDSLDTRPCPDWFVGAKFGIFIHWGVYSVPAWAPKRKDVASDGDAYAEWYGWHMRQPGTPFHEFHKRVYGGQMPYNDFASWFRAQLFDPQHWASMFRRAGAQYVVLTSKHHDGYCLYPSAYSPGWNSMELGPHRDLVGSLSEAVRTAGMRFGLYYSLMEWDHPLFQSSPERYALEHMLPQMKELIEKYQPALLYTDGEWDHPSETWHSCEFLSWLFNESPVRDSIAINDRWGAETRSTHGGFFTTEYGQVGFGRERTKGRPWEEIRGIGASFGYNRNEDLEDYLDSGSLVRLLADTVLDGGNLCLNVGPTADGKISPLMQERLYAIGNWLNINGEAVFDATPWTPPLPDPDARYMRRDNALYAYFSQWPRAEAVVQAPPDWKNPVTAELLGDGVPLPLRRDAGHIRINTRGIAQRGIQSKHRFVFKIQPGR